MKRKLFIVLLAIISVLACAFGLTACGTSGGGADGTYYLYENGNYDKTQYIILNGKKWTDDDNEGGTFTLNGTTITFYAEFLGSNEELYGGTLSDGVLTINVFGATLTYCKEGSKPSSGNGDNNQTPETPEPVGGDKAMLKSVEGAEIDNENKSVYLLIDTSVTNVPLNDKVEVKLGCSWGLYYDNLGVTGIATKIATQPDGSLDLGDNIFYILVFSSDESEINVYTLNVHRSYEATVNYYSNKQELLKTVKINTGYEYSTNYSPTISGYTFNYWKDSGNKEYVSQILYSGINLYADCTPLEYTVSYNANGGEGQVAKFNIKSGESFEANSGLAFSREYFNILNFNTEKDGTGRQIELGAKIYDYDFAENITLYAIWQCYFETQESKEGLTITGLTLKNCENLVVPEFIADNKVIAISSGAFSGYSSLESITLPFVGDSVKSETDKYQYPFGYIFGTSSYAGGTATTQYYYGSSTSSETSTTYYIPASLKSVTITGGNILHNAFKNCSGLTSVIIGDGVTSIGDHAFWYCKWLMGELIIPDSVTSIGDYAFDGCSGLTSVTIGNGVTSIGSWAFANCSGLTSVTIGNGVTSIGDYAFYNCSGLTSVIIPDSVTSIGDYAFAYCSGLTSVTIGNGVTSIGNYAFQYCSRLTSVTIGNGVTSIGNYAFSYCYRLVEVYNKSNLDISVGSSDYGNVAYYARNVYTQEGGSKLTTDSNGFIIYDGNVLVNYVGGLTEITIPDNVTSIGDYAFRDCSGLTSITIPDSVTSIGKYAFYNCSGLTSITIPDSVTSIGFEAFYNCSGLTSVTIGNGVTSIGNYAFAYCSGLTSVTIGNGVTSIGGWAFYKCSGLTSVTIPDSVTSIGYDAFAYCSGLTDIYFEGTKAQWNAISKGTNWNLSTGNYTIHCTDGDIKK